MEDFKVIEGGVCAAKGFLANGLNCGLNSDKNKNDLGMVVSEVLCDTAAVYTSNKEKGAPIMVTKSNLEKTGKKSKAVIANSKNANTCNADGETKAQMMCELAAKALTANGYEVAPEEVIVASTGVIGQILPIEPIAEHVDELAAGLAIDGNLKAANAIMTTDTIQKEYAVSFAYNLSMIVFEICTKTGFLNISSDINSLSFSISSDDRSTSLQL